MMWIRLLSLLPGWMIRSNWGWANAMYLYVARRAYSESERQMAWDILKTGPREWHDVAWQILRGERLR